MDIRVLQYFLTVAREESITGAAEVLHMTQPPLSRQLKELEEELGKTLFIRGKRKIILTEDGVLLRKRAEELVELMEKTKSELTVSDKEISGDVYIGAGETEGMRLIAKVTKKMQEEYPHIRIHLLSGQSSDVTERLDKGLLDFGVLIEPVALNKYDYIKLPSCDTWGILMRTDSPLAELNYIKPENITNLPILCSRQMLDENGLSGWLGYAYEKLNVVLTFNLINTPALMVEERVGYAFTFEGLVDTTGSKNLCFRPLEPRLESGMHIVWKKHQVFSKAADIFLKKLQEEIQINL